MMENTFPSDVLIEILVWLPVISLLRFKSVCKSWLSLIQSPFFIHLHATFPSSSSSNRFGTFIFQTSPYNRHFDIITKATEIFMLSSSSSSSSSSSRSGGGDDDEEVVFEVEDLGLPPLYYNLVPSTLHELFLVGSCNGILCLYDSTPGGGDISLWNPATRQFRLLPKSLTFEEEEEEEEEEEDSLDHHDFVVGFGFDVKTKDYKVVQITFCGVRILGVQVYSSSTDSWRRLLEEEGGGGGRGSLNPLFAKQFYGLSMNNGLYLNGSYFFQGYHLQGDNKVGHLMVSFDFTQEIFTTMQFPDECDPKSTLMVITCLGDKIVLFTKLGNDYDIWVLNENHCSSSSSVNKEESSYWTKLQQHSFQMKNNSLWNIPRGISNNGEFAFIETKDSGRTSRSSSSNGAKDYWKLQLFNLVTKELAKIEFPIGKEFGRSHVYKPSLVSVIGGGNGGGGAAAAAAANSVIGDAI